LTHRSQLGWFAIGGLAVLLGIVLVARLGPASLVLIEPVLGFGLGFLVARLLSQRTIADAEMLRERVNELETENASLRQIVDQIVDDDSLERRFKALEEET
jgi:hypothetical protein